MAVLGCIGSLVLVIKLKYLLKLYYLVANYNYKLIKLLV